MLKKHLIFNITVLIILLNSCNSKPTRKELIEKDKELLTEILTNEKTIIYKSLKLMAKSNGGSNILYANNGENSDESLSNAIEQLQSFSEIEKDLNKISNLDSLGDISLLDPVKIYNFYKGIKGLAKFIITIDEDMFPTLTEIFLFQNQLPIDSKDRTLSKQIQTYEHFILSQIALGIPQLGSIVSLYEIDKIDAEYVDSKEIRMYFNLLKGIIYMKNQLFYLSEQALSENIALLETDNEIDFHITNIFAPKVKTDKEAKLFIEGVHYFFRGLDRKLMEYEDDRDLGNNDFLTFIEIMEELNIQNHYVQIMELYVLSEMGEKKKAKQIANQMKENQIFKENGKEIINKIIENIGEKNYFGIQSKLKLFDFLMLFINCAGDDLQKVDWEEFKREYEIEFELAIINEASEILTKLEKYLNIQELIDPKMFAIDLNLDSLDIKNKIIDNSFSLFDKATKYMEEAIED
jgi:hypothetical protein